jgi:hypothetical protein
MAVAKPLFLRVGLPFGVVAAFTEARGWWEFAVTCLVAAAVLATALTAVTELSVAHLERSRLAEVTLFAAILTTVVGVGAGTLLVLDHLPHGRWYQLPTPPEPIQTFVGPTCHNMNGTDDELVSVRGASGRTFSYHGATGLRDAWRADTLPTARGLGEAGSCRPLLIGHPLTPSAPGPVAVRHQIDDNGVDCGGRRYYLLLTDGTLWTWSTGSCALAIVFGLAFLAILFVTLTIVTFVSRLRLQPMWSSPGTRQPSFGAT